MNNSQIMLKRLRSQVIEQNDKHNTYKILKSDLCRLLSDYTCGTQDDVELSVSIDQKGKYVINMRATAKVLNRAGSILPD